MSASESHRITHQFQRGLPANSSINLPISQRRLEQRIQQSNNEDGAIPVALIGRPANPKHMSPFSTHKTNGLISTGRRLPNLEMFYGPRANFRGRQFSSESQQPLNDSTNSSLQREEGDSSPLSYLPQNRNIYNHSNMQPFIFVNRKYFNLYIYIFIFL